MVRVVCGNQIIYCEGPVWHMQTIVPRPGVSFQQYATLDRDGGHVFFQLMADEANSYLGLAEEIPRRRMGSWGRKLNYATWTLSILYVLWSLSVIVGDMEADLGLPTAFISSFFTGLIVAGVLIFYYFRDSGSAFEAIVHCMNPACPGISHVGVVTNSPTFSLRQQVARLGKEIYPENLAKEMGLRMRAAFLERQATIQRSNYALWQKREHSAHADNVEAVATAPARLFQNRAAGREGIPTKYVIAAFVVVIGVIIWVASGG